MSTSRKASAFGPTVKLSSGHSIPLLGFGTWGGGDDAAKVGAAVAEALAVGYRHIDCAQSYGNEKEIGHAIGHWAKSHDRSELFVTSKVWNTNHRKEHVRPSVLQSIADLQCQYLDLCLIHWPVAWKHQTQATQGAPYDADGNVQWDNVPLLETWRALEALVDEGLVLSIGVSNFPLILLHDLLQSARIPPAVNQVELHPYLAQSTLLTYCNTRNVHLTGYGPLGRPFRVKELSVIYDPAVKAVASALSASPDEYDPASVLLAWNILRGVSVVPKSSTPTRITHNFHSTLALLRQVEERPEDKERLVSELNKLDRSLRYCNLVMVGKDQGKFIRQGSTLYE